MLVSLLFIYETRSINNAHQKPAPPDQTCVLLRRSGSQVNWPTFFFSNAESKTSETIQSADEAICHHMGEKKCGDTLWEQSEMGKRKKQMRATEVKENISKIDGGS